MQGRKNARGLDNSGNIEGICVESDRIWQSQTRLVLLAQQALPQVGAQRDTGLPASVHRFPYALRYANNSDLRRRCGRSPQTAVSGASGVFQNLGQRGVTESSTSGGGTGRPTGLSPSAL